MTGQPVQVTVTLTAAQYRALATIAERKQTNARRLIEGLVDKSLRPPKQANPDAPAHTLRAYARMTEAHLARIRELAALNWSDSEIARDMGVHQSTVQVHRKRMGVPGSVGRAGRPRKNINEQENPA